MVTAGDALVGCGLGLAVLGIVFGAFKDAPRMIGDRSASDRSSRFFMARTLAAVRWATSLRWLAIGVIAAGAVILVAHALTN